MPQIIDGTRLNWQKGTFSSTSLAAGTPFYQNCNADNNARIIATTPVALHGEGAVFEAATGWYVQVYGVDADLNYLGQAKFASAAATVNYTHTDVAYAIPCLRRADGTTNVYPADVTEGLLTVKVSIPFASKHIDADGLSHLMSLIKGTTGEPSAPYTEVEWVESNGQQFVQLDWYPSSNWGFAVDFSTIDKFPGTGAAGVGTVHTSSTTYYCSIFGTCDTPTSANDYRLGTYDNSTNGGVVRSGNSNTWNAKLYSDGRRQTCSLIGTTYTNAAGTTSTVTKNGSKTTWPMTVFGNAQKNTNAYVVNPGAVRIYSLKFYEGTNVVVDLIGAYRNSDGCAGLYDKVSGHFYPAAGLLKGSDVGELGAVPTVIEKATLSAPQMITTNTASTRLWTAQTADIDELVDGQQILLRNRFGTATEAKATELAEYTDSGSSSNVYLKLTLSDGTDTKWFPCYYSNTGRLTSHYGSGSEMRLVYRENVVAGSNPFPRGWWVDTDYNSDNQYDRYPSTVIAGLNGLKRYTVCMKDTAGNWTSITTTANSSASTGKAAYTGALMLGKALYMSSGAEYAAGANGGDMWQTYPVDLRYSFNGFVNSASTQLQLRKPFYIVGTVDSDDGYFYLDTTQWWTQTPNDTTKVYLLLGHAYNSYYQIYLAAHNPAYIYDGSKLVEYHVGRFEGSLDGNATTATSATTASALTYNPTGRPSSMNNNYHDSKLRYYIASGATSTGKPPTDANVLHLAWDNSGWDRQLALGCNSSDNLKPKAYIRTENGSGTWGDWQTVYTTAETVAVANGGTGQTTAQAAANALIGALDNSAAQSTDYTDNTSIITTNTSGTTGTYYHRKASLLWNYIKGKIGSVLGLTADDGAYQQAHAAITVKTGSSKQSHISLQTLMTWLITTKKYIPSGKERRVELHVGWSYADNDILQFTANSINYELQLAGCIIVFEGNATAYNAGRFRLKIYSSPADSFTAASGYSKVPLNSIAVYSCNGSGYAPVWNLVVHTGNLTAGTGLSKTGFTLNHSNSVTAGTAGTSSATSGTNTLAVPYVTYDAQGHVTASGTHTHTIGDASTSAKGVTQLSSATDSTSEALAATPKAVSSALAAAKTYADGKNNQNAFSNVKVGSTTVAADTTTDTLELAGSNVTLTPDATNDKVTIGITASNVTSALGNTAVARATADASGNNIASTYANQNAFSNVKVGSTTVAADTTTDTLELTGSNVTLTPDATNDKVTIGITASNVTTALGNTAVARATADASGNTITSTYATQTAVSNAVGNQQRIRDAAYSGSNTTYVYRKIAVMPVDNASDNSSLTIIGRSGGWIQSVFGHIDVTLTNRTSEYSGESITAAITASGAANMFGFVDVVAYKQTNKSAIIYLKLVNYFAYDLVLQSWGATIDYSDTYVTPSGTLIWTLSQDNMLRIKTDGTVEATKFKGPLEGNVTGNVTGNLTGTASKATADASGNTITSTYLKKSGGTMTGKLTLQGSVYEDSYSSGALDLQNSNILNVNSIYTADLSDSGKEGIQFYRDSTHVDTLYAKNGTLYFCPNRELGSSSEDARQVPQLINGQVGDTTHFSMRPYVDRCRANRLMFLPASQVIVEQTTDGGQTWVSANASDNTKTQIFSGIDSTIVIPRIDNARSELCAVRITITGMKYTVPDGTAETGKYSYWSSANVTAQERYFNVREWWFWITSAGDRIGVKVEAATGANPNTWVTYVDDSSQLNGWSGSSWFTNGTGSGATFGGGTNQTSNRWNYRLTFTSRKNPGHASFSQTSAQSINQIRCYGDNIWGGPYSFMSKDHLYSWDAGKNAYFPANIYPGSNKQGNLGSSSYNWNLVYADKFIGGLAPTTTRPSSANTTGYAAKLNYFLATSSMTTAKPDGDGHVLDMEWDNNGKWHAQLSLPTDGTKQVQWRSENGGTWTSWYKIFDDAHTIPIANGGTGATTADTAWIALGGGAIGKKASLAASDIPNLSTDKLTSGTLGVARGGTGKDTHTSNAVLTGNGTSAVKNVATASGAFYATAANGAPSFGTLPIAQGGTGKTTAADARTALGVPPTSHASTGTTYGTGTDANYGHLKLSASTGSTSGTSDGIAATPSAVKAAYDLANSAKSIAQGSLVFDTTYTIANGTATFSAHVYQGGEEITSTLTDSQFTWYYRIGTTASTVSLGTGKTKAVTITTLGYGGHVGCTFDDGN